MSKHKDLIILNCSIKKPSLIVEVEWKHCLYVVHPCEKNISEKENKYEQEKKQSHPSSSDCLCNSGLIDAFKGV